MKAFIYYALQWTWGIVANIIGALLFVLLNVVNMVQSIFSHRNITTNYMFGYAVCTVLPGSFGGFSCGMFFFRGRNNMSVCPHEYGHTFQNIIWRPLYLVVIALPSAIRYWYRIAYYKWVFPKSRKTLPSYDSIWFEGQATKWGEKAIENYKKQ